jgi:hypothetical protein
MLCCGIDPRSVTVPTTALPFSGGARVISSSGKALAKIDSVLSSEAQISSVAVTKSQP